MSTHFERDLEHLNAQILELGGLVELAVDKATRALVGRRVELAREVLAEDKAIDRRELLVDDECLKILALHQPVAGDLRFVTSAIKINNDLERIGDLAVNVAERAIYLAAEPPLDEALSFDRMTAGCRDMLRDSLDSLVRRDSALARKVRQADDVVDDINREHFELLLARMKREPGSAERCLALMTASLHFERIADLSTNIAEDVIFMVDAVVVRHGKLGGSE